MTLEKVKQDIADGKVNAIYYSAKTLWWTHLDADVAAATAVGAKLSRMQLERTLADPNADPKIKSLAKQIMESDYTPPMDPSGSTLYMIQDKHGINEWIAAAERKPQHFGEFGLKAFMKAHHQNCAGLCFPKWAFYNALLIKH